MSNHGTPTRMLLSKSVENDKCWRGCAEIGASCVAGGNGNGAAASENTLSVSYNIKHIVTV